MTTMAEVARAAGVSVATVSRVINDTAYVADETRQRVETAIASVGYVPNRAAKALRTRQFGSLAVAVGDAANPFFAALVKGVQAVGEQHGCTVLLHDLDHRPDRLVEFVRSLPRLGVDGAVIATGDDVLRHPDFRNAAAHIRRTIPLVVGQRQDGLPAVISDHASASAQAVDHLADMGVERPLFVGTSPTSAIAAERHDGFLAGARRRGLVLTDPLSCEMRYEAAYETVLARSRTADFDGIVAVNDQVALGGVRALLDAGLEVPTDVAVVGFDGMEFAPYVTPSLSTMALDVAALGRVQAEYLLALIAEGPDVAAPPPVDHVLVVRESSRRV